MAAHDWAVGTDYLRTAPPYEEMTIQELIAEMHGAVRARETQEIQRLVAEYKKIYNALQDDISALRASIKARQDAGETVPKSWLWKQARWHNLRKNLEGWIRQYTGYLARSWWVNSEEAFRAGIEWAQQIMEAVLQERYGPEVGARLAVTFGVPDEKAVQAMLATFRINSPLVTQTFANYPSWAVGRIMQRMTVALYTGKGPRLLSSELAKVFGLPLTRAITIARTEYLRALRAGTLETWRQNPHIARGWVWMSVLGTDTCANCVELHGSVHDMSEDMDDHPRGHCYMVVQTPTWDEMGLTPPEGTIDDGIGFEIPDATEWFNDLPRSEQLRILGPTRLDAYEKGVVKWGDFVKTVQDPDWGRQFRMKTLAELGLA